MTVKRSKKASMDTAGEKAKVLAAATRTITPPKHIRMDDKDMDFFEDVVAEFARVEWTEHQLSLAAMLARAMRDLEYHQYKMRQEGAIVYSEKGTPIANPLKQIIQMEAGVIFTTRRSLALNARAQKGEPRDQGKRREKAKDDEDTLRGMAKTGLIPTRPPRTMN